MHALLVNIYVVLLDKIINHIILNYDVKIEKRMSKILKVEGEKDVSVLILYIIS